VETAIKPYLSQRDLVKVDLPEDGGPKIKILADLLGVLFYSLNFNILAISSYISENY